MYMVYTKKSQLFTHKNIQKVYIVKLRADPVIFKSR